MRIKLGNCLLFALFLAIWHNLFVACGLYVSKRLTTQAHADIRGLQSDDARGRDSVLTSKRFSFENSKSGLRISLLAVEHCNDGRGARRSPDVTPGLAKSWQKQQVHSDRRYESAGDRVCSARSPVVPNWDIKSSDSWMTTGRKSKHSSQPGTLAAALSRSLADFLRTNVIDEAAIYLPLRSYYEHASELVSLCEQHGIVIRFDSQVFKLQARHSPGQDLEENSQVVAMAGSAEIVARRQSSERWIVCSRACS